GPPFLQRYLPFWAAILVDRLVVLLLPVFALLLPLLKVAPSIYSWRVRSKIFRCYGDLKFLENEIKENYDGSRKLEYLDRLDRIEEEAYRRNIPLAYSDLLYTLREHIELVRHTLDRLAQHTTVEEKA
ncbi:MAG TPA: C4-dicarboxylate ABC transporter substrate-binding protein, partial [Azospira sp.]|nr:C4-dicarboxylate ABC transporter substrate-binding protein [Azospira sp.]